MSDDIATQIQSLIDSWYTIGRRYAQSDATDTDGIVFTYFQCADALSDLMPAICQLVSLAGDDDITARVANGYLTPNQARRLLGYA